MSDRLHVDDALPTTASRVYRVDIRVNESGEDRRFQLEGTLEGGLQDDVSWCIGRVRLKFELCV